MSSASYINSRVSHPISSVNIKTLVETLKGSIKKDSNGRRILNLYKVFQFKSGTAFILKKKLFKGNNNNSDEIDGHTEFKRNIKLITLTSDKSKDGIKVEIYQYPKIKYHGDEHIEPTERMVDGRRVALEEQSHIEIPRYTPDFKDEVEIYKSKPLIVFDETYYNYLLTNKEGTIMYYIKDIKGLDEKLKKILHIDVINIVDVARSSSSSSLSKSSGGFLNIKKVKLLKSYN
jgi:hypothetical protein